MRRTAALALASLGMLLALLAWADARAVAERLARADTRLVAAALAVQGASVVLIADRQRRFLAAAGAPMPLGEAVRLQLGVFPATVVMPLRTSELVRARYVQVTRAVPLERAAGALLGDVAADLAALALVGAIGCAAAWGTGAAAWTSAVGWALASLAFAAAAAAAVRWGGPRAGELGRVLADVGPARFAALTAYSALAWSATGAVVHLALAAVGADVPLGTAVALVPAVMLASLAPVALGGVGTREAAFAWAFSPYAPREALVGAGVLASALMFLAPALAGLAFMGPVASALVRSGEEGAAGEGARTSATPDRHLPTDEGREPTTRPAPRRPRPGPAPQPSPPSPSEPASSARSLR